MNYITADEKLQGRNMLSRKVDRNTYLVRNSGVPGDSIHLKLHNTYIITWYADGRTELNSGGWKTVTTKQRINEFLEGYFVAQQRGVWYLEQRSDWTRIGVYEDRLTIHPDGTITNMKPLSDTKKLAKLRKQVNTYAAAYIQAFRDDKVPAPGPGDCLFCRMHEVKTDKPLGEVTKDTWHVMGHIEENYFVPSLLMNAMEALPHSQVMEWTLAEKWNNPERRNIHTPEFVYDQLKKILARYILRQLGQVS